MLQILHLPKPSGDVSWCRSKGRQTKPGYPKRCRLFRDKIRTPTTLVIGTEAIFFPVQRLVSHYKGCFIGDAKNCRFSLWLQTGEEDLHNDNFRTRRECCFATEHPVMRDAIFKSVSKHCLTDSCNKILAIWVKSLTINCEVTINDQRRTHAHVTNG